MRRPSAAWLRQAWCDWTMGAHGRMKNSMKTRNALGAMLAPLAWLGALALGASACDDEQPFFHHCPLSSTIIQVCEEESTDTELTCVVKEHPMCDEKVCAAWAGSDSFCTRSCADDSGCPAESTCKPHLDFKICVPNVLPVPYSPFP